MKYLVLLLIFVAAQSYSQETSRFCQPQYLNLNPLPPNSQIEGGCLIVSHQEIEVYRHYEFRQSHMNSILGCNGDRNCLFEQMTARVNESRSELTAGVSALPNNIRDILFEVCSFVGMASVDGEVAHHVAQLDALRCMENELADPISAANVWLDDVSDKIFKAFGLVG